VGFATDAVVGAEADTGAGADFLGAYTTLSKAFFQPGKLILWFSGFALIWFFTLIVVLVVFTDSYFIGDIIGLALQDQLRWFLVWRLGRLLLCS
jgi:hypothetical protein